MNTNSNNLKTFQVIPFGAESNPIGYFPAVEPQTKPQLDTQTGFQPTKIILPFFPDGKSGLLDDNLVRSVQVVDTDTGFPLEKVNVFAKANPTRGGSTDANGNITIVAQSPTEVIVFQYQDKKIERVFNTLGGLINIDTKQTLPAVPVGGPKTDSKVSFLKWAGIGIGALVLLSMLNGKEAKKVKV